jgi:hypothetical protein
MCAPTGKIPLALRIDGINVADNEHALAVLRQAQASLAGHATLRSVALDHGFLDARLLWAIEHELGLIVYIPARSNMIVAQEARRIARAATEQAARGRTLAACVHRERQQSVTRGADKNAKAKPSARSSWALAICPATSGPRAVRAPLPTPRASGPRCCAPRSCSDATAPPRTPTRRW